MASINIVFSILTIAATTTVSNAKSLRYVQATDTDYMRTTLDGMQVFFDGENASFNVTYYAELQQCFNQWNDTLLEKSQNMAWKGQMLYYQTNGTDSDYQGLPDHWGQKILTSDTFLEYDEGKSAYMGPYNMYIYEPCNYASNIAYYHSTTKICKYGDNWSVDTVTQNAMKRAFAALASMSAFFHGSYTRVGQTYDNQDIALIASLGHHASVQSLLSDSTILHQLSETPRNQTILEICDIMTDTIYSQPVSAWRKVIDESDYEHSYQNTFGAIIANILNLVLPESVTKPILIVLSDLMLNSDQKEFLIDVYLPELFSATKNVSTPLTQKFGLLSKGIGVIVKIVYAFCYQEQELPSWITGFFDQKFMIAWGAKHISKINSIADWFTGFEQTDYNVNESVNVYPGQSFCKTTQAHSIWHEQSANGLLDLIYLCDYTNYLTEKYNRDNK